MDQENSSEQENLDLTTKLNRETAKIAWTELQRFYASGSVIAVASGIDLIQVAKLISEDNAQAVEQWLADGKIYRVDDSQAAKWLEDDLVMWAVVVAPWVLVQEI